MERLGWLGACFVSLLILGVSQAGGCGGDGETTDVADTAAQGGGTSQGGAGVGGMGQGASSQGGTGGGGGAGQGGALGDCMDVDCGGQLCSPQLGCVDCLTNTDCMDVASPICVLGSCEECGSAADCDAMEYCHPEDFTCEAGCTDNNDCNQGDADVCDTATGACVQCLSDMDCMNGNDNRCSPFGLCVRCLTAADCSGGDPVCDPTAFDCVECLFNADCDQGEVCEDKECN